jgi:hypothetical protein
MQVERLCFLLEEHALRIKEGAPLSSLIHSAQDVMDHALGMERHRLSPKIDACIQKIDACIHE